MGPGGGGSAGSGPTAASLTKATPGADIWGPAAGGTRALLLLLLAVPSFPKEGKGMELPVGALTVVGISSRPSATPMSSRPGGSGTGNLHRTLSPQRLPRRGAYFS